MVENTLGMPGGASSESMPASDDKAMRLVLALLSGQTAQIKPRLDLSSELGFSYPSVEELLGTDSKTTLGLLEDLSEQGVLKRTFFDKLLLCPQCRSLNLRPSIHCPKCGSANIVRGRVLEHSACSYVGTEEEFMSSKGMVCPKCKVELQTQGVDYKSLGLLRKCRQCSEVFSEAAMKWSCLRCYSVTPEGKVDEVNINSYSLDESKRSRLEFETRPKSSLVEFLKERGYHVRENAVVQGRSGASHTIDMLATRDDGIVTHSIAIGVEVVGDKIGLEKIFKFDDKTYDIGIHDKILIVIPNLEEEAETFASQQRIKVLEVKDLDSVLGRRAPASALSEEEPFAFKSKSGLMEYLKHHGYEVTENALVKGRSGAEHTIDLLATRDDGIIVHNIAVGIETAYVTDKVGLDKVFDFDGKTFDIGIRDRVFIALPGLTKEGKEFANRQRIRVIEAQEL